MAHRRQLPRGLCRLRHRDRAAHRDASPVATRHTLRGTHPGRSLGAPARSHDAYASSIDQRLWGRLAAGWQTPLGLYAGPEVEAYRERDYRKLRLGLHLTGLRLLGLEWRLSGGWQQTSDRPSEIYGTLALHWLR